MNVFDRDNHHGAMTELTINKCYTKGPEIWDHGIRESWFHEWNSNGSGNSFKSEVQETIRSLQASTKLSTERKAILK